MRQLGVELTEHAPDILRLAAEAFAETALWRPPAHSFEPLAEVVVDLMDASLLHPHDLAAHERKIAAAVCYGERRRAEGLTQQFIFGEFGAIREGIHRYLARCTAARHVVRDARMRLEMAVSVAELAAIRGFHRDSFERAGLWPSLTADLARESPLLGLPEPS
jgi:hypothetical protein